jgi:hypothetical protein
MGLKSEDLSPALRARFKNPDGSPAFPADAASVAAAAGSSSPPADGSSARPAGDTSRRSKIPGPKLNRWEEQYAQRLHLHQAAGIVVAFWSQAVTLRLADDTRYTPDFLVLGWDFPDDAMTHTTLGVAPSLLFVEVKGFQRDDAIVKFKVAAEQYAHLGAFVMVERIKGGGWKEIRRYERQPATAVRGGAAPAGLPPAGGAVEVPRDDRGVKAAGRGRGAGLSPGGQRDVAPAAQPPVPRGEKARARPAPQGQRARG